MKKLLIVLLAVVALTVLAACSTPETTTTAATTTSAAVTTTPSTTQAAEPLTYAEYIAAEMDSKVVIEAYVQATQSWWDNKITVYAQDEDGAYFLYEMACPEADASKLTQGTKIRVTGYKSAWKGEIEITDATFEIVENSTPFIATPYDVTALLGQDGLIDHQNKLVAFKGMTVEKIEYKNGEPGDDIYLTLSKDGTSYEFCVEVYLTGTTTEVYQTVGTLNTGDVVDVEGFLYWYDGMNPHVTAITPAN